MNIGKAIFELRKKKNITQEELAAELGVSAAAVSKWENGYTLPDILMLCALADFFQVTTDELLGRNPKPFCAAVATDSDPQLGQQIAKLVEQYGFPVKHIIYGSYQDALEMVNSDPSVTHLFVSYQDSPREYKSSSTGAYTIGSCGDTLENILNGFTLYLKNMPHFNALAQKENDNA